MIAGYLGPYLRARITLWSHLHIGSEAENSSRRNQSALNNPGKSESDKVQGLFISRYLHKVNIERKV